MGLRFTHQAPTLGEGLKCHWETMLRSTVATAGLPHLLMGLCIGWEKLKGEVQLANRDVILSFDVNNDKFGEIALPDGRTTATTRSNEETKTSDGVQGETGHHHI